MVYSGIINDAICLAEEFGYLSMNLNVDLNDSLKNKIVESDSTKTFLDFLLAAEDKRNLVDGFGFGFLIGKMGYIDSGTGICFRSGHTDSIDYMGMLMKVNKYLMEDFDRKKDFNNEIYFPFVTSCRKVAKNILKYPKVRLAWDGKFMKEHVEVYKNFIDYLRK